MSDQFPRLNFPFRGVYLHDGTLTQPPETTPVGQNVRAYDASQDRRRGGSRAGISRWIDEQVSGSNPIQFLGSVTSTDPDAMGWVFEGEDFGYTGVYGGIGFVGGLGGLGGEIEVNGDGGYPSTLSYNKPRYHLEMEESTSVATVGDVVVITGRFFDQNGDPPDWEVDERRTVELRTSPASSDGYGDRDTTNFAGVVSFSVENDVEGLVIYSGKDITKRASSTVSAEVTWDEDIPSYTMSFTGGSGAPGATITVGITTTPIVSVTYSLSLVSGGLESGITFETDDVVGGTGEIRAIPGAAETGSAVYSVIDQYGVNRGNVTLTWA